MKQNILLQAAPAAGGDYSFLIMIGGMVAIMYFFMIRPQMKKQKEAKSFRETLQKGDKVVTIGGIHGKVVDLNAKSALLQIDGAKIRVELTALNPAGEADAEELQRRG
jgi:preprotein translocase subunit YajC